MSKEIPSFLAVLEGEPLMVTIHRSFGGTTNYTYKFTVNSESKTQFKVDCLVSKQGKKSAGVLNSFRLIQDRPNLWVLVFDKKNISPVITLPIEYRPKINSWVLTGSFDAVRALFTLNNFEDGFGLLSSLACSYATVQFHCITRFMTISCYGIGGFLLNQAKVDERTVDEDQDEEQDDHVKSAHFIPNKTIAVSTDTITKYLQNLVR